MKVIEQYFFVLLFVVKNITRTLEVKLSLILFLLISLRSFLKDPTVTSVSYTQMTYTCLLFTDYPDIHLVKNF